MLKLRTIIVVLALLALLTGLAGLIHASGSSQSPIASFTYSPDVPSPQESVSFDASTSYATSGVIVQYAWDFGDGTTSIITNPLITHSFLVDGDYTVQLTVTDNSGNIGTATAVVQVRCVIFFRVVILGQPKVPVANVKVTAYTYNGSAWVPAPANNKGVEIKYDNMTQPKMATTNAEKDRNPGYTASTLLGGASNIGFEVRSWTQKIFFKIQWGSYVAYWPNATSLVYSYDGHNGQVETYNYDSAHQAQWDPTAQTYVIKASHIPGDGVAPTECHPIIVGISCPPPTPTYYLTVNTLPQGITQIPGQGAYIANSNATLTAPTYVSVSSNTQYRFDHWDVDGVSMGSGVNPTTVLMSANHTATAHYVLQYAVTFDRTGLSSDATGTIVTVNSVPKTLTQLPYTLWVDSGGTVTYSYTSPASSSISGKQFRLNNVTGPISPITVSGPTMLTGNYVAQYSTTFAQSGLDSTATGTILTVNGNTKAYSNLPFSLWVDSGSSVTYLYTSTVSSSVSGKQFRLNSISGSTSPITVLAPMTITGNFVIQYKLTFTETGLDSSATGTVVTVNGNPKGFVDMPFNIWADTGSTVTYSYVNVSSSATGKRFILTSVGGTSSPITVSGSTMITGNYKTQLKLTFDQTGVGTDFAGTVVTIDSSNYNTAGLPAQFWWDQNSSHTFAFVSPLTVNSSIQYLWSSTSGLSTQQSSTLTVSISGNVVGSYVLQNSVTFDQIGLSSDFTGTVVIVDGNSYGVSALPISFNWQLNSVHTFAYQSPLIVTANGKQYVWTATTGLSFVQTGSLTVSSFGSVIGNYKTQYYLTLATNPGGAASAAGAGWYDANAYAAISTTQLVDIVPGSSRYMFSTWTTIDMSEITNLSASATTVLMDETKTVTANYNTQYFITFSQTGVGSDFSGAVMTIDFTGYTSSLLPVSFWWNASSSHTFSFSSPLVANVSTQYVWASTTGLTTVQSGTLIITGSGSVVGNYSTAYKYQITFDQSGASADYTGTVVVIDGLNYNVTQLPVSFWWDANSVHNFAYQSPLIVTSNVKQYVWTSTTGLSSSESDSITIVASGNVDGNYKTQFYLTLATDPSSVTTPSGAGWYDSGTNASISTVAYIDIVPGSSRYRFDGWTTANMDEISDSTRSPTTVTMDQDKTVTATYVIQYKITFDQAGVGSDFTDTIVVIDGLNFNGSTLPVSFMLDQASIHTFSYSSPLVVNSSAQYSWVYTSGLSALQADSITIASSGDVIGNYGEQITYNLTVTATSGGTTNPAIGSHTYLSGSTVQVTAIPDTNFQFDHWELDSANVGTANPYSVLMNLDHTLNAVFVPATTGPSVTISPMTASIHIGEPLPFTSIVTGGVAPFSYQWYLDGAPFSGATSNTWTWTPTHASTHTVYLKVTDSNGASAQSTPATITVSPTPVGGYSIALPNQSSLPSLFAYVTIVALSGAILSSKKRKRE